MKILTWLWKNEEAGFNAQAVNNWASMLKKHTTKADIACVTDSPEGIDPDVEIIPVPKCPFKARTNQVQFPRLSMFHPFAGSLFGDEDLFCMDLDCIVLKNIDHLLDVGDDKLRFHVDPAISVPYSLGLQYIKAGSAPEVYMPLTNRGHFRSFTRKHPEVETSKFVDLLWVVDHLGTPYGSWGQKEGVYSAAYVASALSDPKMAEEVESSASLIMCIGDYKPWKEAEKNTLLGKWYTHQAGANEE